MRSVEAIEADLAEFYAARQALARSQEYATSDGRRLRRADLSEINKTIATLERELTRAKAGGGLMARRVYPYGA